MRNDFNIEARIMSARKKRVAINNFWINQYVDTYSKYLILRAIPMNLLLWGYEAWSLCAALKNKLEVFRHHHSRQILKISMFQVKDDHIHQA